uniref:Uncharacterized protein n=1 Tax=Poecilia mexicana TaxID=48701 RepID=A0A3B3YBL0_9TELE
MLREDKETQLSFSQETDSLTTASSSGCQENVQRDSFQNRSQNSLHVSSLTDEVAQLNNSIQSLKTEQKELTANISSLREEQKEVAKLSCLVVKCQERNILLAEMMKSMHRDGSLEPRLTQQAEHLLSDAALQDYAAAFSPESKIRRRDKSLSTPAQLSPVTASLDATIPPEKIDFLHLEVKDKHSPDTAEVGIHSHGPPSASSSTRVSPSRRLSSPEKILNLQEELQKTLMDSVQVT